MRLPAVPRGVVAALNHSRSLSRPESTAVRQVDRQGPRLPLPRRQGASTLSHWCCAAGTASAYRPTDLPTWEHGRIWDLATSPFCRVNTRSVLLSAVGAPTPIPGAGPPHQQPPVALPPVTQPRETSLRAPSPGPSSISNRAFGVGQAGTHPTHALGRQPELYLAVNNAGF